MRKVLEGLPPGLHLALGFLAGLEVPLEDVLDQFALLGVSGLLGVLLEGLLKVQVLPVPGLPVLTLLLLVVMVLLRKLIIHSDQGAPFGLG